MIRLWLLLHFDSTVVMVCKYMPTRVSVNGFKADPGTGNFL